MARTGHFCGGRRNDRIRGSGVAEAAATLAPMTNTSTLADMPAGITYQRANALAERLEQGARALITFASGLTDAEWHTRVPHDGRTVGVTVHHVASVYPVEIELAQVIARGEPITAVTSQDIDDMNARHAAEYQAVTKANALELLEQNSAVAARAIREFTDDQLAAAVPVSLYGNAPLTCQFFLEDHAVRHSYHHLARLRQALRA